MAAGHIILPVMPARDINGNTISGAQLFFYESGTTTPKAVYTSSALTTAHAQPVVSDAAGAFPQIFGDDEDLYTAVCYAPAGRMLPRGSFDDVNPTNSAAISAALAAADEAEGYRDEAETFRDDAQNAATSADQDAATAAAAAISASADAIAARAAAEASGDVHFFDTKAAAITGLSGLVNGDVVEVFVDESRDGQRTRYVVESGSLVFKVALSGVLKIGHGPPAEEDRSAGYIDADEESLYPPLTTGFSPFYRLLFNGSSLTPSMVTRGALGVWKFGDYVSTGGKKAVPNLINGSLPANLIPIPSGWLGGPLFSGGATVTDRYATGPGGEMTASRVVGTGGWYRGPNTLTGVADGTYTFSVYVKDNGASNKNFQMQVNGVTVTGFTANGTWQRFSTTKTITGGTIDWLPIWAAGGSSDGDFLVDYLEIVPGASVGTPDFDLAGNIAIVGSPSLSGGYLDMLTSYGGVALPATTLSSFTVYIVGRQTDGTFNNNFLSKTGSGYTEFSSMFNDSENKLAAITKAEEFQQITGGGYSRMWTRMWRPVTGHTHVITWTVTPTESRVYVNNVLYARRQDAHSAIDIANLAFSFTNATSLKAAMQDYAGGIANVAWTPAEVRRNVAYWEAKLGESSSQVNHPSRVFAFEGDSIEAMDYYTWPYVAFATLTPSDAIATNFAASGSTLDNLEARAFAVDEVIPPDKGDQEFWLSATVTNGVNSYAGATDAVAAAAWAERFRLYLVARRAAGFDKIIVQTLTPRGTASGETAYNARRAIINPIIRSWLGNEVDYVVDFAANATMGPDAAANDPALYGDGTHPTVVGQQNLAAIFNAMISGA